MNILDKIKIIKKFCVDILFPVECLGCGQEGVWLCNECFKTIPLNRNFFCPVCGRKSVYGRVCQDCQDKSYLDGLLSAGYYQNKLLKEALHNLKYNGVTDLTEPLGRFLIDFLHQLPADLTGQLLNYTLASIPLHRKKFLDRGFNQSELLAEKIGRIFNLKIDKEILKRSRNTPSQTSKKDQKRIENIQGAFICSEKNPPEKIILIDDVFTSGSTLQEAAKTLKAAGVKSIWGLTLMRG